MKKSLRIIHIVSSLNIGGMERFLVRLAEAQMQRGHKVSILAMKGGPLEAEVCELGIPTVILGGMSKLARLATTMKLFLTQRPDIIHAQNKTALHYGVFAQKFCQAPVVVTNHGQGLAPGRALSIAEWKKADAIVMVSNAVMDSELREALGERLHTIYNGVAFSQPKRNRQELRAELGIPQDRAVGIIVARIDEFKGHENLLNALKILKDQGLPLTLLLAGDGASRADREKQAQALGLGPDDVRFLGFRSDVADLLAASDFFVLPSLTEGLPLSVLEAMSHSLPTVATNVGGVPELVTQGEHGLLLEPQDEPALAAAMQRVITDADLRKKFGTAAKRHVETDFSFETMTQEYDDLYAKLLGA